MERRNVCFFLAKGPEFPLCIDPISYVSPCFFEHFPEVRDRGVKGYFLTLGRSPLVGGLFSLYGFKVFFDPFAGLPG